LHDPVDLDCLLHALGQELRPLAQQGPGARVACCATSGTPQLSLALTLAAMALFPQARHYQALDPSHAQAPLLREFDPDTLHHQAELDAALRALENCQLVEAALLFERRLNSAAPVARSAAPVVRAGQAVARALAAIAAFNPRPAAGMMQVSRKGLPNAAATALSNLETWFSQLSRKLSTNERWPVELAALSLRQQTAGLEAPALLTAAIAFEVALAVRLRTAHQFDPDRIKQADLHRLPEPLRQKARQFADEPNMYRVEGARLRSQTLAHLDSGYNDVLHEFTAAEKALIEQRNDVMHQAKGPEPGAIEEAAKFLAAMFAAFDWPDPSSCPSAPRPIAELVRALRSAASLS